MPTLRKGILLAGGTGTRMHPLSVAFCKQLLPVYDKPLIYYPLSTLMLADVREIMIITTPRDLPALQALLGDGQQWGLALTYATQDKPEGIAQALVIAEPFLGGGPSVLALGDNIFYSNGFQQLLATADARMTGATIFACHVDQPQEYGVVQLDAGGVPVALEEKPAQPRSNFAVPGLYFYDGQAPGIAANLARSARGEYEITDVNARYLEREQLHVELLGRGSTWMDTGHPLALLRAANFVASIEERQGLRICCPEEIAFRRGFITQDELAGLAARTPGSYGEYLQKVLDQPWP